MLNTYVLTKVLARNVKSQKWYDSQCLLVEQYYIFTFRKRNTVRKQGKGKLNYVLFQTSRQVLKLMTLGVVK